MTGNHSDGLVKQENAFIDEAFTANVHRAHSGVRGIVNSYESYENIHRFLFGDTKVEIVLDDISIPGADPGDTNNFYNFEFRLSVRNTGVFLHERREDRCENAERRLIQEVQKPLPLHTAFLNSLLTEEDYLHFLFYFRVVEHRVDKLLLWSHEYPGRPIYSETLEVGVNTNSLKRWKEQFDANPAAPPPLPDDIVRYHWLSEAQPDDEDTWPHAGFDAAHGAFKIALREAPSFSGNLYMKTELWNLPGS